MPDDPTPEQVAADLGRLSAQAGARLAALDSVHEGIDQLRRSIDALAESVSGLASKDEIEARLAATRRELASKRVRSILAFGVALVAVMSVLVVLLALVVPLRAISEQNRATGRNLIECTTPGNPRAHDPADRVHECYDEGQARTAAAVAAVIDTDHDGRPDVQELRDDIRKLSATSTTSPGGR